MLRVKSPVVFHVVAWIIFILLPFVTMPGFEGSRKVLPAIETTSYWLSLAIYLFVFYFNAYFLMPRLYLQKKYVIYTVSVLAVLVAAYFLKHAIDMPRILAFRESMGRMPPPNEGGMRFSDTLQRFRDSFGAFNGNYRPPSPDSAHFAGGPGMPAMGNGRGPTFRRWQPGMRHQVDLFAIFLLSTIWALSTSVRITQQWSETEKRAAKAEADKANAELSFLKAQINPHFLFNTLNNIYSLAIRQHENTADSIMKLSNIMRYVTDDVNRDFVSLEDELECITNYIDLQRLRLSKKVNVEYSVTGEVQGKRIPPLVLMTFIENVFKYGISNHEPSTITIKIFAEEKNITFFCQNKLFSTERKVERTGIGIANTRQRLEHLYPNRHLLNITSGEGLYTVQLTLLV